MYDAFGLSLQRGRVFTAEELMAFDGTSKSRIYLAVLGEVYDVTRGKKHYGKIQPAAWQ